MAIQDLKNKRKRTNVIIVKIFNVAAMNGHFLIHI